MKIYTKTGDDGTTGLIGGRRVRKCDDRIESVGEVDELNAALGWVAVVAAAELKGQLTVVQNDLFVIGSHLAIPEATRTPAHLPALEEAIIARLEMEIDSSESGLAPLRNFILPGGAEIGARLHLARTICRRAERRLVAFAGERPVPEVMLTYLNRLSDWLFVQARLANQGAGVSDIPWLPGQA
jgi:cob(I)alamin adenosyltransferase